MACSTRLSCFLHPWGKFDSSKQLTKADFRFFPGVPSLSFAGGRLFSFVNRWLKSLFLVFPVASYALLPLFFVPLVKPPAPDSQAFNWVEAPMHPKLAGFYLSNQFLRKLRDHLALVVSILCYKCMGHSVCRGGVSIAYNSPAFSYSS